MVQRGRKCVTRIGPSGWNRAWWVLSLSQLGLALKASTMISLACVGEVVVEMMGLCIGGVMSSAAVAVQLGDEDACVLEDPHKLDFEGWVFPGRDVLSVYAWLRYVDDISSFSYRLCPQCMVRCLRATFTEPLSIVFSEQRQLQKCDLA